MFLRQSGLALLFMLLLAGRAAAGFDAVSGNAFWLYIMPDEPESDAVVDLTCRKNQPVELRLGAIFTLGTGKHEAVSATLSAGKREAQIDGVSMESVNVEMTGGVELYARLSSDHEAFAILASGQEIALQSGGKTERFTLGAKPTAALKMFLRKCG